MPTPTYNMDEILRLAQALRAGQSVSPMEPHPGQLPPDDVLPDVLNMRWDNSDPGRYTPDMLSPEGKYIRDALEITPGSGITPVQVQNPNAPQPPAQLQPRTGQPTTAFDEKNAPTPQENQQSSYQNYLDLFQQTLPKEPQPDSKRRNQLAMVAGINALGQALKQVVDFTGRQKYGSPINPQNDPTALQALSQYEKLDQEYKQRKDRYDLQKTNTMQQALQYAYGDEKAREQYEKQLDLLNRQQDFSTKQTDKEINARKELFNAQKDAQAKAADIDYERDLKKMEAQYGFSSKLIGENLAADMALLAAKTDPATSDAYTKALMDMRKSLAGEDVPVVDQATGTQYTLPKELYFDVAQKIMKNPLDPITRQLISQLGPEPEQNKTIINTLIASEWQKYYEPVVDSAGNQVGFRMKSEQAPDQKEYKTFWDFMPPGSLPNENLPDFWTPTNTKIK